jgi:hypothetical protein
MRDCFADLALRDPFAVLSGCFYVVASPIEIGVEQERGLPAGDFNEVKSAIADDGKL